MNAGKLQQAGVELFFHVVLSELWDTLLGSVWQFPTCFPQQLLFAE